MPDNNLLYYGDNLDVLRRHVKDETVDLVYLDPPFNSNANYNVLFAAKDGTQSAAQIQAFEDTWRWDEMAARQFSESVEAGGRVADALLAFERLLGANNMLAYLTMMAPRLVEMRRVLKPSGSLYLHCDPTASHYLKLILDAVFGAEHFRNEIIWKRAETVKGNFGQGSKFFDRNTDTILFYAKSEAQKFFQPFTPYSQDYVDGFYKHVEEGTGRRYQLISMTGPGGAAKGNPEYEVLGIRRYWRYSEERMHELIAAGMVVQTKPGTVPRRKLYLDQGRGVPVQSLWDDIPALHSTSGERLGYPTQKPLALLERIIEASTQPGDTVLDPFCGCGTTVEAAQKLERTWIGIDVTHLAISLIKVRLQDTFGEETEYAVIGEPTTAEGAAQLAASDKYQFQWWALGLVGARPVEQKKGADRGIDGRLYFHDGGKGVRQIIFSVKGGKLKATDVRDLRGVVDREKAEIGVLLSFDAPTQPMRTEAASAGFYTSPWGKHARLQLLTVADLLNGAAVDYPQTAGVNQTYKQAPTFKKVAERAPDLFGDS